VGPWIRPGLLGLALGLLVAALASGGTSFDAFLRVGEGGNLLFDARLDEPAVGRVTNIPTAVLGEASFSRRSWFVTTSYAFSLRVRPDVLPETSRAVRALVVSVALPGRVTRTNATRASGGVVVWETLPAGPLQAATRAIHWGRIALLGVLAAAVVAWRRRT
jgi:hypothetical protein